MHMDAGSKSWEISRIFSFEKTFDGGDFTRSSIWNAPRMSARSVSASRTPWRGRREGRAKVTYTLTDV